MILKIWDRNNILPTKEGSDVNFVGQIQTAEFTLGKEPPTANKGGGKWKNQDKLLLMAWVKNVCLKLFKI